MAWACEPRERPRRAGQVRRVFAVTSKPRLALLTRTPLRRGHAVGGEMGGAGHGRGGSTADRVSSAAHTGATKGSSLPFLELDPAKNELQQLSEDAHRNSSKVRLVVSQSAVRRASSAAGCAQVLIATTTGDSIARIKQWYRYHRAIGVDVRFRSMPRTALR